MKEERMKILKMVEDGKISVDDAAKLMESMRDAYFDEEYCENEFTEKMKRFGKDAEEFLKNVGCKMGEFAKDMEPKVKNVTRIVVSKTANIVEEVGKALGDCLNNLGGTCGEDNKDCCCGNDKDNENREN